MTICSMSWKVWFLTDSKVFLIVDPLLSEAVRIVIKGDLLILNKFLLKWQEKETNQTIDSYKSAYCIATFLILVATLGLVSNREFRPSICLYYISRVTREETHVPSGKGEGSVCLTIPRKHTPVFFAAE